MDVLRKEELDKRAMTYLINRVSEENVITSNKYIRRFLIGIMHNQNNQYSAQPMLKKWNEDKTINRIKIYNYDRF